jgi:O-antigen/teichoic acid export membrane protein
LSSKKGLVRNIFSVGLVQIANYVFPVISVPIVSRIIGPDKFGVINFAAAFMAYFTLLINYGFDLSATRAIAARRDDEAERNRIFNQVLFAKLLLLGISIVVFLISLFAVPQLRDEKAVAVFSFLLCISWVITPNWLYQGMQELTRVAIFNLATKILFTVVIIIVIKEKSHYVWQPLIINAAQLVVAIFSFVYAIRRYKINIKVPPLKPVLDMLKNERMIFFSMVVINLYTTTNTVLLGFLQPAEQVGYYTAGYRLIVIIQSIIAIPLAQSFFPFVGAAFSQGKEKGLEVVKQLFPLVTLITFLASAALWLLGPFIITSFYGQKFAPGILAFRVMAFIPLIMCWNNLLGIQTMINLKMDKPFFRITLLGAVSSIILNLILVNKIGYLGTAWSLLLTEMLITLMMYIFLTKKGISIFDRKYFSPDYFIKYLKPVILTLKQKIRK